MSEFSNRVECELERARLKFGPMHGPHEALGVIREEYFEFEHEVFKQHARPAAMLGELIQIAAMCQRAVEDLNLIELGDMTSTRSTGGR
jgi:hypothetical protein